MSGVLPIAGMFSNVNGGTQLDAYYPVTASFKGLTCISVFLSKTGTSVCMPVPAAIHSALRKDGDSLVPINTGADGNITNISQDSAEQPHLDLHRQRTGLIWTQPEPIMQAAGAFMAISLENMIEDYEHNYWVASSRHGLLHLVKSQFHVISALPASCKTDVYNAVQLYYGDQSIHRRRKRFVYPGP
jgi:hypothetical protein